MNVVTYTAFQDELEKIAAFQKEALFGFGQAKKVVKPFVSTFKGHGAALAPLNKTTVGKSGVETAKAWNPMAQTKSVSRSISIPGVTNP